MADLAKVQLLLRLLLTTIQWLGSVGWKRKLMHVLGARLPDLTKESRLFVDLKSVTIHGGTIWTRKQQYKEEQDRPVRLGCLF